MLDKSAEYTKHSEEISGRNNSVWLGAGMETEKYHRSTECQMQVLKCQSYRNCTVHRTADSSR